MVQLVDRELLKLQGIGDHLKADATKPSRTVDGIFYLVVPTDGANCSFLNFLSYWIIRASTCQHVPTKHTREWRWCARRLSYAKVISFNLEREIHSYFAVKRFLRSMVSPPLSILEEGCYPLSMGSRRFPSKTEGECGDLFVYYDLFLPLYGQTTLIFWV